MTMQRVQWTCPVCKRRFAIPATAPTPTRCPQCRQAEEHAAAGSPASVIAERVEDDADEMRGRVSEISPLVAIQLEVTEEAARGPMAAAPIVRRVGPSLEMISMISRLYLGLAGLSLLCGVGGLLYGLWAAFAMPATPARATVIFVAIASFGGSLLLALIFFTIREVIRLLLDIEANTR